jgi:hypothetical protein
MLFHNAQVCGALICVVKPVQIVNTLRPHSESDLPKRLRKSVQELNRVRRESLALPHSALQQTEAPQILIGFAGTQLEKVCRLSRIPPYERIDPGNLR